MLALCSAEQKSRGTTPREVLARLSPAERVELLDRLRQVWRPVMLGFKEG
jgi:hypothetical protein